MINFFQSPFLLLNANKDFTSGKRVDHMKFAWLLIFMNAIVSVMAADMPGEDDSLHGNKVASVVEQTAKMDDAFLIGAGHIIDPEGTQSQKKYVRNQPIEPTPFYSPLDDKKEKIDAPTSFLSSTATLIGYTPHLIPIMLGIVSFNTKDPEVKKLFTKICGYCFLGYYFRLFHHGNLDHPHVPNIPQSIYFYATLYGGVSYFLPFDRYATGVLSIGSELLKKFR